MTARPGRRVTAAAAGLGGGLFSGLTGVGGGAVMVPLMTGVLRIRQHVAHGTSLVIIVFAAAASAAIYQVRDGIDWALVAILLPAALAGAYAGARLVHFVPELRLRQLFGASVLLVGLRLLLFSSVDPLIQSSGVGEAVIGALIGLAGGAFSGALGVGGGAIFVPAMVLLLGTDQHAAQGASLCVIVAAAAVGASTHARHGSIDMHAARWIVPFAVPAGMAGAAIAAQLDASVLQRIFALVAVLVGAQALFTATRALRTGRAPTTAPAGEAA